ncbi:MAG: MotA/TolQ/ExbB proton channel family protein [Rhodobacteraceae bacterium]|nr:MotA/TolQ/ExbB proton channel family protein [Paracoccaceae bacterium]
MLGLLDAGGPVVYVLGVLSLISLSIIVVKLIKFNGVLSGRKRIEAALGQVQARQNEMALQGLKTRSPSERVLAYAIAGAQNRIPQNVLDAEVERRGNAEIEILNRGIRMLEVIALVSPLLGLLGTVLGMIQSFQELEMAEGAANASVLAGGIWQALLTTAVGLVVAIPAAIGASLFSATVERAAHLIETSVGRLNLIVNAPQSR